MMAERKKFFSDLLLELQQASSNNFRILQKLCQQKERELQTFPLPETSDISSLAAVDHVSKSVYPENDPFCTGYVPVKVLGDGNCLCRTGSLYAFGNEDHHPEIRSRIVIEMCLNLEWYLTDANISTNPSQTNLSITYAQYSNVFNPGERLKDEHSLTIKFQEATAAFTKSGAWGEIWHLFAMSSVLNSPVLSVYPDLIGTQRDRKLFHRKIFPRLHDNSTSKEPIRVFWTNLGGTTPNERWWVPNHFVGCKKLEIVDAQAFNSKESKKRTFNLMDFIVKQKPKKTKKENKTIKRQASTNTENIISKQDQAFATSQMIMGSSIVNDVNCEDAECNECEEKIHDHKNTTDLKENTADEQSDELDETLMYCFPDEDESGMECATTDLKSDLYEGLSNDFYKTMGLLAAKNHKRDNLRQLTAVETDSNNTPLSLKRNEPEGEKQSLKQNVDKLRKRIKSEIRKEKRAHLYSVIACGEYILSHGPLVKTQLLSKILKQSKLEYLHKKANLITRIMSAEVLETLSRNLPVMQIYINKTGYIMEYRDGNIQTFVDSMANCRDLQEAANKNLESTLQNFKDYVKIIDTQLDKAVIRAILVELFSVNAVSRLNGSKCKQTLQRARDEIPDKLKKMKDLGTKLLTVRNDMTNIQQNMLHKRSLAKAKAKAFKARAVGGGRQKLCEKYPQLSEVFELAFGEGSKIHPRLTKETRFRSPHLAITMPQAREILLSVAADKIPNIALSTCYTYTQNFRSNSHQAKRHHAGQNVNANISLKRLPRVGMLEEKINAHYCRSNINFQLEKSAEHKEDYMVDAKDAKGIVCADIDPVQNMGKSWKKTSRLDHQFDQSRTNACTPMTHLFLETVTSDSVIKTENLTVMNVIRTGQPVTLINVSLYEPETVFRCFNELFLLLANPALDHLFRNPITGGLKKNWVFLVDNGPSEAPASVLIRMLLVRLVNFLDLDKALQISFEKLNSKDNPAERPHASENLALSRHGPFKTEEIFIHKNAKAGSKEHTVNMEAMADKVIECIKSAKFGGHSFFCFRGVKEEFIFSDEVNLRNFLRLSEQGKDESVQEYTTTRSPLLSEISSAWHISENFSGRYIDDYNQLCNSLLEEKRTSWLTDYMGLIYSLDVNRDVQRYEKEPLPDYIRWMSTGALHYMSYEDRRDICHGEWDQEALFLPASIINHLTCISFEPPESIMPILSLLVWVTPEQLKEQMQKTKTAMDKQLHNDQLRDKWKQHELFEKTNVQLESICKAENLPTNDVWTKLQMIDMIAKKRNIPVPELSETYSGDLSSIPTGVNDISNLSLGYLRTVLHYHNVNYAGTKDELVLKLFLLRHERSYLTFHFAEKELRKLINIASSLIVNQRRFYNDKLHIYRKRKFSTMPTFVKNVLPVPSHITDENLHQVFDSVLDWIDGVKQVQQNIDRNRNVSFSTEHKSSFNLFEQCKESGSKVKVFWERSELGTFVGKEGWNVGWYNATVVSYDEDLDTLDIEYTKESGVVYTIDFSLYLATAKMKFISSPFTRSKK